MKPSGGVEGNDAPGDSANCGVVAALQDEKVVKLSGIEYAGVAETRWPGVGPVARCYSLRLDY